ncbi:MAG: UDP-N-acetylmuramoyl-L-alanyl-D-glutamate--2,6-diaminopimelate ligase [Vampirovibrionales bacterium]|nr:UDP-N-acetylmuramoyl-L-alanyl-D-glutamate--2,6-diaminopimelate ligase [Vampirovibrionales bacterium]
MKLSDLLSACAPTQPINPDTLAAVSNTLVSRVTSDSRQVQEGAVFVALSGARTDGHNYLEQAFKAGALAIVMDSAKAHLIPADLKQQSATAIVLHERPQQAFAELCAKYMGNPAKRMSLVGVTGTNGKTSVTHLIEKLLSDQGRMVGLLGTLGVRAVKKRDGLDNAQYDSTGNTTPMADELQQVLANFAHQGINTVVMEVSSHALEQYRVHGCDYQLAVLTNLTQDHLDYHKSMEAYCEAKKLLFSGLKNSPDRAAVINLDDAYAEHFLQAVPALATRWTYSINNPNATVRATNITYRINGADFTVKTPNGSATVKGKLGGRFGVYNMLAALTSGLALGINLQDCVRAIESVSGVRGRFEVVAEAPDVIVDYAHTPDGLENVLEAARAVMPQASQKEATQDAPRLIVVFGCGGDRDATKRPKMGAIAERLADIQIVTSDNPRTEDPQQIITDILSGINHLNPKTTHVEPDRRKAIHLALRLAKPNDVIVIAGKGHEDYQILSTGTIHFDDREEVLNALQHRQTYA